MKKILVPIFFIVICYSCHFGYSKNVMPNEINDSLADTITVKNINDMQKVSNAHVLTNRKRLLNTWCLVGDEDYAWIYYGKDSVCLVDEDPSKFYHYEANDSIVKIDFFEGELPYVYKYRFCGDTLITILLDGSKYQECKMVPVK